MPHLFLHQRSGDERLEDLEGADYATLELAVDEAVAAARQLMADGVRQGIRPDGWRFEITSAQGQILAVVPFQDTLSEDGVLDPAKEAKWYRVDAI